MNARQLIHNESSLRYPVSSSLIPNNEELPRGSIKQSTQAACTRIVWLLYLVSTLSALVLACVLRGALGLLWCWSVYCLAHTVGCELRKFDQEAIVETTNERTAIDSKRIITVLPRLKLAGTK